MKADNLTHGDSTAIPRFGRWAPGLQVVVYRSAQKFDTLGWDNYCGGIMTTLHEAGSAEVFDQVLTETLAHVTSISRQGLTHLHHCLQPEMCRMLLNSMARARAPTQRPDRPHRLSY